MTVKSVRARDFWQQLESRQKDTVAEDEPDYFQRGTNYRSSYKSAVAPPTPAGLGGIPHEPVWGSIYCTIRDRSRGRGRSTSASSQRGVIRTLTSQRSTSTSERSTPSPGRPQSNMSEVGLMTKPERTPTEYTAPKRYESTCYFMPLAVPVWYSSSVSMKVNSTKRTYKETVNYQKKLVPYRFVETMTTVTSKTPQPVFFVSDLNILREVPEEHYLSLEDQQTAASDKPFATNHHINIENHA